jgi:hypothetical protein
MVAVRASPSPSPTHSHRATTSTSIGCSARSSVAAATGGAEVSLIDGEMTSWYGSRAIRGLRYLAAYASERATT